MPDKETIDDIVDLTQNLVDGEVVYHVTDAEPPPWWELSRAIPGVARYCATSGSSPHNEWYLAATEKRLRDFILDTDGDTLRERIADIEAACTQELVDTVSKF